MLSVYIIQCDTGSAMIKNWQRYTICHNKRLVGYRTCKIHNTNITVKYYLRIARFDFCTVAFSVICAEKHVSSLIIEKWRFYVVCRKIGTDILIGIGLRTCWLVLHSKKIGTFAETEFKVMDIWRYLRDTGYFPGLKNVRFPLSVIPWVLQTCLSLGADSVTPFLQ
jgi:hypothetical protein